MRALTSDEITGTWATVLTPFDAVGSLDLQVLDHEMDAIVAARPQGMYTHGTAGEFFNQTEDEWDAVTALVAARGEAAALPFQLGASHPSPITALGRIERARRLDPSAIQVILPDWLPISRDEVWTVIDGYTRAAGDIGLVLYNPPHAKNVLGPEQLDELTAAFPGVVGIKMADGDAAWYEAMKPVLERVSVFVPGHHLATGLTRGARGAYSNVACLHPAGAVNWAARSVDEPEWGLAVEQQIAAFLEKAIAPLIRRGYSNVTLDKTLAAAGGHLGDVARVRWPHATATAGEIAIVRAAASRILPGFLRPDAATVSTER
jgi:4-hydroxy-tetrahydrodipicolinate synthase